MAISAQPSGQKQIIPFAKTSDETKGLLGSHVKCTIIFTNIQQQQPTIDKKKWAPHGACQTQLLMGRRPVIKPDAIQ